MRPCRTSAFVELARGSCSNVKSSCPQRSCATGRSSAASIHSKVAQKNVKLAPFAGLPQFAEVCRVEKLGPSGSLSLERGLSLLRCLLADPTLNQKGAENVLAALEAFRVEANDERQEDDVEKDTEETQTSWDRHYHLYYNEEQRCSDLRAGQTRKEIIQEIS